MRILILLLLLCLAPLFAQAKPAGREVVLPGPGGIALKARLYAPEGPARFPAVVALHGCGGPFPSRDYGWARRLAGQGHAVLLPDSFASRGLKPECRDTTHAAPAYTVRRADALAAAQWLAVQPFAPKGGVMLLGWSDGGTTVLAGIAARPDLPPGLIAGAIAFYPACSKLSHTAGWAPAARLMILIGADDDWTSPVPCEALAGRHPGQVSLHEFPGAYHDFDAPDDPVHVIAGLPYTRYEGGTAHAGENPAARAAALSLVPQFMAELH